MEINELQEKTEQKKPNKFVAFLKRVFVHNIGWKILAVVSALLIWLLSVGLTSPAKKEETKPEEQEPTAAVQIVVNDVANYID